MSDTTIITILAWGAVSLFYIFRLKVLIKSLNDLVNAQRENMKVRGELIEVQEIRIKQLEEWTAILEQRNQ